MCGIFGYIGAETRQQLGDELLAGLKTLEYRGYDSWGVALFPDKGTVWVQKQTGKIGAATLSQSPAATMGFGHTRWATHGGVTQANAHPHLDCTAKIAVVHNGIIENFTDLKAGLVARGHHFVSETDSEIIAHLVEEKWRDGGNDVKLTEIIRQVFLQLEGMNAIIVGVQGINQIAAAKKGSPLVIGRGTEGNWLASDVSALTDAQEVYFLHDDEVVTLTASEVEVCTAKEGTSQQVVWQKPPAQLSDISRGDFAHFMLKEVHEQPACLTRIASMDTSVREMVAVLKKRNNWWTVGCGSASYVGLIGSYVFSQLAERELKAICGSEFVTQQPFVDDEAAVLAVSQSGETMDTLEPVKQAQRQGALIGAIVNVQSSTLDRLADARLYLQVGTEKAVASTKAVTAQVALLMMLAGELGGKLNEVTTDIARAVEAISQIFSAESTHHLQELAARLIEAKNIFIIGRQELFPVALECALKMKEISYIHAEGMAAGELKHGTLALITEGVPCVVLVPEKGAEASISSAMELKARGARVIGVGPVRHEVFDDFIEVATAGHASLLVYLVVGQLLAYYMAVGLGNDPDMPRNLAKSVTVK